VGFGVRLVLLLTLECSVGLVSIGYARAATGTGTGSLSALLERMRDRNGPVWRTHLRSSSRLVFGDQSMMVHTDAYGMRFVTYQCTGSLCVGQYFDGERLAQVDINGTALPSQSDRAAGLRAERMVATLQFLASDFASLGGSVTDQGVGSLNGLRYRVLLVESPDGDRMEVYVDPALAVVRYARNLDDGALFEYRDRREVGNGISLPYLVLRNGTVLERYLARSVATGGFKPPHGPTPAFSSAPASVSTDPDRPIPIFPCELGGVSTTCLLDSGNSGLAISRQLADQLRAHAIGAFHVSGLGNYTTDVVRAGPLTVANATYPDAYYVVLDDIHSAGYDVVLGADVLASTTIELDGAAHSVTFDPASTEGGVSIPLIFSDFVPVLAVQLGDLGTKLALDTGDESNINLAYDFYRAHPQLFETRQERSVRGIGGNSIELIGSIPDVRIGNLDLHDQAIGATQSLRGTAFGHLGAGFLQHLRVIFDYAAERVLLVPEPAS
jgi:hypothetical protein